MRQREQGTLVTRGSLSVAKILDITTKFPLLHAYGVGLDIFRELPEQYRMRVMDYAKFILQYCLDDEIDDARRFFKAIKCSGKPHHYYYVKVSYLQHVYRSFIKTKRVFIPEVPYGAFIVAGLSLGQRVKIIPSLKPDCLINVQRGAFQKMEKMLEAKFGHEIKPEHERVHRYKVNDDRADEVRNEPQSIDAVENVKGE